MKRLFAALLLILAASLPASAGSITVFAAASLTNALADCKTGFEAAHPGDTLAMEFAASGTLLERLGTGVPYDVFVSADPETMTLAVDRRRVDGATLRVVALNDLVLAVPAGNPAKVDNLDSLSRGGVRRIGVGNPESVPAGRYAKRALQQKALWFALTSKLVYYPSVRHVLAALAKDEIDAGFVYATDAASAGKAVAVAAPVPLPSPVTYVAAVAAKTAEPKLAAAFISYLASPQGVATLGRYGFAPPPQQ
ncbi:molybdate ABC transporter substrate-binding protein [Solidesulfovibrio magneticus]|uniref:Molybdenum ABC transporter substrate binding protein n=1 Tax=Solidesulfovibrio magneticus (strain ATCC 700980 / DSM 13731 / RS-1) TaxID=573370 RepID=C4XR92_SOLM1|nr:molybdate ABC transporter substrate-binding protein [Solidesulfovibrio magneticus]BAH75437.1 putative molybdenum ABC transporter substrate binding protein precursor [Solidesulfovibrio magneticus RS-1]